MRSIELNEGATDILYHYTSLHAAAEIFKDQAFKLSTALGTPSELETHPVGFPYYLSTTRSKVGRFHRHASKNSLMFVLDGQWFQQRYPVKPMDYWAGMSRDTESEDRVYSARNEIPLGGVREVHVLFTDPDSTASALLRKILIACKQQHIKTYVYQNESAWRLQNTRKALDSESIQALAQGLQDPEYGAWSDRRRAQKTQDEPGEIAAWSELLQTPRQHYQDLSARAQKIARDFMTKSEYNLDRDLRRLANDIHNNKSPRSGYDYPDLIKLTTLMKQHKLFKLTDLIPYLSTKWSSGEE